MNEPTRTTELAHALTAASRYGVKLTDKELAALKERNDTALSDTGRVGFGGGILPKLITAFSDAPDFDDENAEPIFEELLDAFYEYQNAFSDALSDDELLMLMRKAFDVTAGDAEAIAGLPAQELVSLAGEERQAVLLRFIGEDENDE